MFVPGVKYILHYEQNKDSKVLILCSIDPSFAQVWRFREFPPIEQLNGCDDGMADAAAFVALVSDDGAFFSIVYMFWENLWRGEK